MITFIITYLLGVILAYGRLNAWHYSEVTVYGYDKYNNAFQRTPLIPLIIGLLLSWISFFIFCCFHNESWETPFIKFTNYK